jgi:hypothetical protein
MESLPVVGEITSRFARARRHPLLGVVRRHDGIDIAAAAGTHIIAPAAGRVIFSGRKFGYGNTIDLDHGNGVITRYAHCRSLMVREGDEVAAGAVIGTVGRSGLATAPHLHYEVRFHGRQMNPLRTPLQSLIEPKQPGPPTPAPVDASARPTPTPDAPPSDSPVPPVPSIAGDTIAAAPPAIARMSLITESPPPSVVPIAPVPARDTTRKS